MRAIKRQRDLNGGFTLVEMLVVVGILGILAAALIGSFSHLQVTARQAQAQTLASEVATAFTVYLQRERSWPTEWVTSKEMDEKVCRVFQRKHLFDVTTYELDSGGNPTLTVNKQSLDRFGLLDPWGRAALRRNPGISSSGVTVEGGAKLADHRLQYRLDTDYDGFVDSSEGAPEGVKIRASVIVWSRGPDGKDDFDSNNPKARGRYPYDDRLSWNHGQARAAKN